MQNTTISTATTTVCKSTSGKLVRVVVTGGTAGTIKIYDHASSATNLKVDFDSTNAPNSYEFDMDMANGVVVVTGGATKVNIITGSTNF